MVTTSKSMHREVQIKHDLMTRMEDGIRHKMSGLCEKANGIYIVFTSLSFNKSEKGYFCRGDTGDYWSIEQPFS